MEIMRHLSLKSLPFTFRRRFVEVGLLVLVLAATSLVLIGSHWGSAGQVSPVRVGLVPTEAGVGDLSFNWMAYQGLQRAGVDLGVVTSVYTPTSSLDYGPMLQQCVDEGNRLCIGLGFNMADAVWEMAETFPGVNFAIVDATWESYPPNLRGISFASEQAGYLAGVLAGLMTESEVVGAVGGVQIPPLEAFIEPYRNGVGCARPNAQAIITYTGSFVDFELGVQTAQEQMDQGADVIFGAGGITGHGAILEAAQAGAWAIGVDTDQWLTLFDSGSVAGSERLLTSAMKRVDNAVYETIADEVAGTFTPGTETYDLSLDGVGLAPFHEADPSVPSAVKDALEDVRQGILAGAIDVWAPCREYRANLPLVLVNVSF